jgi:hypothetical protein
MNRVIVQLWQKFFFLPFHTTKIKSVMIRVNPRLREDKPVVRNLLCPHRTGRAWCFEQKLFFIKSFLLTATQQLTAKNPLWSHPHFRTGRASSRLYIEGRFFSLFDVV